MTVVPIVREVVPAGLLETEGSNRDRAVAELHELLLKAARFEVRRRRALLPHLRGDLDDVAQQAASDALIAVLQKLDTFRGESRFTTWAYKFAIYEAAVKLRRLAWQGHELPALPDELPPADPALGPESSSEQREFLDALGRGIREALSDHQREVLLALAVNGVPIDVLAERVGSNRNALYKTLHDARKKLRAYLESGGFSWPTT